MLKNKSYYFPAVAIGGVVGGFVSGVPIVGALNCCFCLLMQLAAGLSVFLVMKKAGGYKIEPIEGAIIGGISGIIGGVVTTVIGGVFALAMGSMMEGVLSRLPGYSELPFNPFSTAMGFAAMFFRFILNMFLYPFFGALGGLLAAFLLGRSAPAAEAAPAADAPPQF